MGFPLSNKSVCTIRALPFAVKIIATDLLVSVEGALKLPDGRNFGEFTVAKRINEIFQVGLRLRGGLKDKLEKSAHSNEQSLNSEIVGRLESSFDAEQQNLDYRAMVSALSGGGENAQLLSMLSSALQLATSHSKDKSSPEAMDSFREAINLIVLAHSGRPIEPVSAETVFDMTDAKHRGYMIADVILGQRNEDSPVHAPHQIPPRRRQGRR